MIEVDEATRLAAARAGDQDAFEHLTGPYQRELLVHCYRMLGSLEDAEDTLQETLLRAWRRLDSFEGRASLRAWLYKIATNASLDALDRRPRRVMPQAMRPPAGPDDAFPGPAQEHVWLEPLPDALIDERPVTNPEARYEARESVAIAFLAALQNLPGRQRAVLILRDVLGWKAGEAADLLSMTVAAVNSALQRARTTMQDYSRSARQEAHVEVVVTPPVDSQTASLLARYVEAWEAADAATLVSLLREDAVITMPPLFLWYRGREAIKSFLDTYLFRGGAGGRFRLVPTRANGVPAFAVYQPDETGRYGPAALQLLTIEDGRIAEINDFLVSDDKLFSRFGLPLAV
jgi:RNA polymerase sigma-70 factor (ECF subfamily)